MLSNTFYTGWALGLINSNKKDMKLGEKLGEEHKEARGRQVLLDIYVIKVCCLNVFLKNRQKCYLKNTQ